MHGWIFFNAAWCGSNYEYMVSLNVLVEHKYWLGLNEFYLISSRISFCANLKTYQREVKVLLWRIDFECLEVSTRINMDRKCDSTKELI